MLETSDEQEHFQNFNKKSVLVNINSIETCDAIPSQEHCTDWVTGFPIRKLILIPLITFFGDFATFFGNNFLLLQRFLIKKLLLEEVILPYH